jgi:hypothetical protein
VLVDEVVCFSGSLRSPLVGDSVTGASEGERVGTSVIGCNEGSSVGSIVGAVASGI